MKFKIIFRRILLLVSLLLLIVSTSCLRQDEPETLAEEVGDVTVDEDATATALPQYEDPQPPTEPASTATQEPTAPSASPTLLPTPTEFVIPTPTIPPVTINGMATDQFIIMPDETRNHVREIFAKGENMGRNLAVFSILGDSLIATPQSLAKWDGDDFTLGDYDYLQPTVDQYAGSFARYGASVRVGLHSWSVFDPLWADKEVCLANEDVLACEIRLNNPSVMIIFLGSNDAGSPGGFNVNYRKLVETLIDQGIVPILATKADRFEGGDNVNNGIIRRAAEDFQVPLLEFDILADTLPGRGLGPDNVHLTFLEPLDYSSPEIFSVGYPVHNLASLMILDEVRREFGGGEGN